MYIRIALMLAEFVAEHLLDEVEQSGATTSERLLNFRCGLVARWVAVFTEVNLGELASCFLTQPFSR